jgi:hypothetical protein
MRFIILGVATACAALLVPVALASKPDRVRVPIGTNHEFGPGLVCPVSAAPAGVKFQLISGNEAITTFDDGHYMATGLHIIQITNLASGVSTTTYVHGSFSSTPQPDGTADDRGSGTTGFAFFPGDASPGDPSSGHIYLFTGTVRLVEDPSGTILSWSSTGRIDDICAEIAS